MTNMEIDVKSAVAEIESTTDLLERALKLSGLVTTMFQRRGFPLVVVVGSAVEFYTEGGYMSGDIDFCRRSLKAIPPRVMQEVIAELGGQFAYCLAALPDFGVLAELHALREEIANG